MWLQMGEDDGAPLVYFHQVKHMWVGYADGRSGTSGGGMGRQGRDKRRRRCSRQGRWSQRGRCCGCRCSRLRR